MVEVVYKPRKPKASPLYQSISEHFSEFESVYEERYRNKYGIYFIPLTRLILLKLT
jgi:hypothetical protein